MLAHQVGGARSLAIAAAELEHQVGGARRRRSQRRPSSSTSAAARSSESSAGELGDRIQRLAAHPGPVSIVWRQFALDLGSSLGETRQRLMQRWDVERGEGLRNAP